MPWILPANGLFEVYESLISLVSYHHLTTNRRVKRFGKGKDFNRQFDDVFYLEKNATLEKEFFGPLTKERH